MLEAVHHEDLKTQRITVDTTGTTATLSLSHKSYEVDVTGADVHYITGPAGTVVGSVVDFDDDEDAASPVLFNGATVTLRKFRDTDTILAMKTTSGTATVIIQPISAARVN